MKITIESTSKVIGLVTDPTTGASVPARVWEGETDSGIKVIAYINRIGVDKDQDTAQFEKELLQQRVPSAVVQSFPLRQIL